MQAVVDAVAQVQPFWAQLTLSGRARYLERAAQVLIDEGDEIRDLIVREQGKPRNEAFSMEVLPTIDALGWIAHAGQEILADEEIPMSQLFFKTKRSAFTYEPLGVIGIISPWNYPWSIPFGEVALALMAGNGVVLKPASLTPLIGERIVSVFERAGRARGAGARRPRSGHRRGARLLRVSKVFFTGSAEVGRGVGEACARQLKGSVLELGGKDPMIVLPDADLDHAVAGALWGGFANAGPDVLGDRAGVRDAGGVRAVHRRGRRGGRAAAGRGPDLWDTEIGPMVSEEQLEIVRELVDDAVAAGAALRCGGPVAAGDSSGFVLRADGADRCHARDADHARGDLRPGAPDRDRRLRGRGGRTRERLAIRARRVGLDLGSRKGERFARELEAGMVWINDHMFSHGACQCSWGGVKESGLGRTHSKFGLYECVNVKLRVWEPSTVRDPWWHPYDETLGRALRQTATILYGRPSMRAGALKEGAVPLMKVGPRIARDAVKR